MRALYTLTIFLSAALLFLVEPMVARMILPNFGGSAQVWNTCLVFFQAALLAGYGYAHLSTRWLGAKNQWKLHVPLMVLASAYLAWYGFHAPRGAGNAPPAFALLGILITLIGFPFFIVSAGSSVLQRWFSASRDPHARDPYFLYAASNLGSLLALLAYPLIVEPALGLKAQAALWSTGLLILTGFMTACGILLAWAARSNWTEAEPTETESNELQPTTDDLAGEITTKQRTLWVVAAAVPSSLLLGVTTYLSTNIAPIPLLWVVPLSLYLITFILAFSRRTILSVKTLGRIAPLIVTPLALAIILESSEPLIPLAVLHLTAFFVSAWMCHARLSVTRPNASHLTEFYFWIALGGVLGGIFNALIAPVIFHTLAEYPIGLVLAMLLRPRRSEADRAYNRFDYIYPVGIGLLTVAIALVIRYERIEPSPIRTMVSIGIPAIACFLAVDRSWRYGLSLGALFLAADATHIASEGSVILSARSFFGVHRVVAIDRGRFLRLTHGNTIHGLQDKQHPHTPLTYYYPNGPIGRVFTEVFHGASKKANVGLVGLGVGSLAAYGEPGQNMDYFEIDPVVYGIASNPEYFTFLRDSKASVRVIMGDARLSLRDAPDRRYGLLVLDAFSSDAIPVHLLTEEAFEMYLQKLTPDGVLAVHISNRYLDLGIVLGAISRDLHLLALDDLDGADDDERAAGKTPSRWVFMARKKADFKGITRIASSLDYPPDAHAWTDDYSNVLSVFRPGQ